MNSVEAKEARAAIAEIKGAGVKVEASGHENYDSDVLSKVPALTAATEALNNPFVTTMTTQFVTLLRLQSATFATVGKFQRMSGDQN